MKIISENKMIVGNLVSFGTNGSFVYVVVSISIVILLLKI